MLCTTSRFRDFGNCCKIFSTYFEAFPTCVSSAWVCFSYEYFKKLLTLLWISSSIWFCFMKVLI